MSEISSREGDVLKQVEALGAAADESYRAGRSADMGRFFQLASEKAHAVAEPSLRSRALVELATEFLDTGATAEAKTTLLDALSAARTIPETYVSAQRYDGLEAKMAQMIDITSYLADLQPLADTRLLALESERLSRETIGDPSFYLPKLAEDLALSGEFRLARAVAERVRDGDDQLQAFAATLKGMTFYLDPVLKKHVEAESRAAAQE